MIMGTKIPRIIVPGEVPAGVACSNCWGIGKTFGNVDTPSEIIMTVSGVNKGPDWVPFQGEPPNTVMTLEQVAGTPCRYDGSDGTNFGTVIFDAGETVVIALSFRQQGGFINENADLCALSITGNTSDYFTGGSVVLQLPDTF